MALPSRFNRLFQTLTALALALSLGLPLQAQEPSAQDNQQYLAAIELHTSDELLEVLERTEELLLDGVVSQRSDARVTFVLHGPEVKVLLRKNYRQNRDVVDLAARLTALGVVNIMACETWLGRQGLSPAELQPFVGTVPYGPSEVRKLTEEQDYLFF